MAEAVQAATGAEQVGDTAQLEAGRAILEAGGWFHRWRNRQDVCGQEQSTSRRVNGGLMCMFHDYASLRQSMGTALRVRSLH